MRFKFIFSCFFFRFTEGSLRECGARINFSSFSFTKDNKNRYNDVNTSPNNNAPKKNKKSYLVPILLFGLILIGAYFYFNTSHNRNYELDREEREEMKAEQQSQKSSKKYEENAQENRRSSINTESSTNTRPEPIYQQCMNCKGTGEVVGNDKCYRCNGTGVTDAGTANEHTCNNCQGKGYFTIRCPACNGEKRIKIN